MPRENSTAELTLQEFLTEGGEKRIKGVSFEHGLHLMEQLVQSVESGTLPLEDSIRSYERGAELLKHLRGLLAGAEEKIKILQKPAE